MSDAAFLSLLIDNAGERPFDYAIPDQFHGKLKPGMRVLASLRGRKVKGTILTLKKKPEVAKVQPIIEPLFQEGAVTESLFELARWISLYYATPMRRVLKLILPSSVRGLAKEKQQVLVKRIKSPKELLKIHKELLTKHPSQARIIEALIKKSDGLLLTELLEAASVSRSPVDTLEKKGILQLKPIQIDRCPLKEFEYFPTKAKKLNPEQALALDEILKSLGRFQTHLLHGITGSGKTEVYLQAIDATLIQKKSVILLVPEIALTAQTIERLKGRFQEKIAILHHRLSIGERHDAWHKIAKGEILIVVGARSALFSPLPNLGLIIVDEEQEGSYKQSEERPCYNARDVAIMRAKIEDIPCLLGSATPSIESYFNALSGKYNLISLKSRAESSPLPKVVLIDLNREKEKEKRSPLLSEPLLNAIEKRFQKGEQSLLFLNRRGYHSFFLCKACEESLKCPHCELSLTFHKSLNKLACHLCDYTLCPPPRKCPLCHSEETMEYRGAGTEQVERMLHAIFPEIRTLRMDADTTRHKGSHDRLFKQFRSGKADVLIGTQMVAKGLHFPSVTLVGVLNTDGALNIPDFRSSERVFQLLAQVSGRSGRGALNGEVFIQTHLPKHPVIALGSKEAYDEFYNQEIKVRKSFNFPPFNRLARFIITGFDEEKTNQWAENLHQYLKEKLKPPFEFFPVTPCGYARIKDRYRFHFLAKGPNFMQLSQIPMPTPPKEIRLLIDIDPLTTYL
ncbi:MAG: primosomal protein N' [Simkaniaceae bacterium]